MPQSAESAEHCERHCNNAIGFNCGAFAYSNHHKSCLFWAQDAWTLAASSLRRPVGDRNARRIASSLEPSLSFEPLSSGKDRISIRHYEYFERASCINGKSNITRIPPTLFFSGLLIACRAMADLKSMHKFESLMHFWTQKPYLFIRLLIRKPVFI